MSFQLVVSRQEDPLRFPGVQHPQHPYGTSHSLGEEEEKIAWWWIFMYAKPADLEKGKENTDN